MWPCIRSPFRDQGGIAFAQWEKHLPLCEDPDGIGTNLDMLSQVLHRCDLANNPCNLCHQFNPRFRQRIHVAPLGLRRRFLSPGYRHVALLGLNAPMHRLPFRFLSCKSFNPEDPDSDNNAKLRHTERAYYYKKKKSSGV